MLWRRTRQGHGRGRVAMLLENQPYPRDVRVRAEAESLTQAGYRVTVLAPNVGGQSWTETVDGVRIRRYRLPMADGSTRGYLIEYGVAHVQLFFRALVELAAGARVVHIHNPPDTLFPIALVARALGRSAVFDQHDLFPELLASRFRASRLVDLAVWAQRAAARAASIVLVTNESQRDLVVRRAGRPPDRVFVVRNGPRGETLASSPRSREGVLTEPRLIYVGELGPQDGVLLLPEMLSRPSLASARLTVVGDGSCREQLERRFAAVDGLAERVRFTGHQPHWRVPELLADADIAIEPAPPSDFNNLSTMVKIAEYLGAGLPVVAFELLETRRTAGDAVAYAPDGDIAALADEVARLAADPARRAELALAGRARAEELVWERSEATLLAAYSSLE
jgi:glycosyltransferase involved in cell wall biosynthesis